MTSSNISTHVNLASESADIFSKLAHDDEAIPSTPLTTTEADVPINTPDDSPSAPVTVAPPVTNPGLPPAAKRRRISKNSD